MSDLKSTAITLLTELDENLRQARQRWMDAPVKDKDLAFQAINALLDTRIGLMKMRDA